MKRVRSAGRRLATPLLCWPLAFAAAQQATPVPLPGELPTVPIAPAIPPLPVDPAGAFGLFDGLASVGDGLKLSLAAFNYQINPTPGTELFQGSLVYQGVVRSWVGIRPLGAPRGAPVLLLLHPAGTTPEAMANTAAVGRLAARYGAWIYLPSAQAGAWSSNPTLPATTDDVGFLTALLDLATGRDGIDASRVYFAGFSNGAAMAERFACERSARVAGLAVVAGGLLASVAAECRLSHPLPTVMFHGTADPVTAYGGSPYDLGARGAIAYFASASGCDPAKTRTTPIAAPTATDPTAVIRLDYTGCPAGALGQLYTIEGGGHTWPDSAYPVAVGATTHGIDATLVLWTTLLPYALP